jgi:GGDEF domain-containing protein
VRYGGDEFAIIFPDVEREQAFLALEKLRADAAQATFKLGKDQTALQGISLCAGIACYPMDGRLKSELLRKADQALYRATPPAQQGSAGLRRTDGAQDLSLHPDSARAPTVGREASREAEPCANPTTCWPVRSERNRAACLTCYTHRYRNFSKLAGL